MLLASPENFSENGARPVQILGRHGRLIGWARSFSDTMTVTDNTLVGGRPQGRLTRIAGRDVSKPDGHTVGKTFSREESWGCPWQHPPAKSAASALNHIPASSQDRHQRVDPSGPLMHKSAYTQNGRGRPASATGCPVSFVPINQPSRTFTASPCPKKSRRNQTKQLTRLIAGICFSCARRYSTLRG
jgi:hypothetical protein